MTSRTERLQGTSYTAGDNNSNRSFIKLCEKTQYVTNFLNVYLKYYF